MYQFLLAIHVIIAVLMIACILLQQGRGAQTGASFGSGASTTIFGSQGSGNFLSKFTWVLVTCFFVINLIMACMANNARQAAAPKMEGMQTPISEEVSESSQNGEVPPVQQDSMDIPQE